MNGQSENLKAHGDTCAPLTPDLVGAAREATPAEIGHRARVNAELHKCRDWRNGLERIRKEIQEVDQFTRADEVRGVTTRIREAVMWLREHERNLECSQP